MSAWLAFGAGLVVGVCAGVLLLVLVVAAAAGERHNS